MVGSGPLLCASSGVRHSSSLASSRTVERRPPAPTRHRKPREKQPAPAAHRRGGWLFWCSDRRVFPPAHGRPHSTCGSGDLFGPAPPMDRARSVGGGTDAAWPGGAGPQWDGSAAPGARRLLHRGQRRQCPLSWRAPGTRLRAVRVQSGGGVRRWGRAAVLGDGRRHAGAGPGGRRSRPRRLPEVDTVFLVRVPSGNRRGGASGGIRSESREPSDFLRSAEPLSWLTRAQQ